MSRKVFLFLLITLGLGTAFAEPLPPGPVYVRIENGWKGFYVRTDKYVEYSLIGSEIKLQDSSHILLRPGLGLMVTFADKEQFGSGKDILEAHKRWEVEYWRNRASKVESTNRDDLSGARKDLKITELTLRKQDGAQLKVYLIAVDLKEGVFVFSVSPASRDIDPMVKELINSVKIVNKRLELQNEAQKAKS